MDLSVTLTTTLGAAVILSAYSLMFYKENPFFRWAETSVVALGVGWAVVITTWQAVNICFKPLLAGDVLKLVPLILGLLIYAQFFKKYRWIIRYPLAIISSGMLAIALTGIPLSDFILQIRAIAIPLTTGNAYDLANGLLTIVVVITCLTYFTYTHEHTGPLGISAKIGRIFMMLALGGEFGMTINSSFSHTLTTLIFLLSDWLGLIPPTAAG